MTNKTLITLLEIIIIALVITVLLVAFSKCQAPKTKIKEVVKIDTLVVTHTQVKTIYRDRIQAIIDSVKSPAGEVIGYEASMDTTLILPKCRVETQVTFQHPAKTFSLRQTVKVETDTVYVNKERIITKTKIKTNWTNTAIGACVGFIGGLVTAIAMQ